MEEKSFKKIIERIKNFREYYQAGNFDKAMDIAMLVDSYLYEQGFDILKESYTTKSRLN